MAYVSISTAHSGLGDRVTAFVGSVIQNVSQYRVYRRTLAELNALSDRELDDIGVNRAMIKSLALETARNW